MHHFLLKFLTGQADTNDDEVDRAMTITSYQVHSVLRTYGKQLKRGLRLSRAKLAESSPSTGLVRISAEAKRNLVVERVAAEILKTLVAPGLESSALAQEVMSALSQEYGQPLELTMDKANGRFRFQALDPQTGQVQKELDPEESARLSARLTQLTEQIVDRNMLKG